MNRLLRLRSRATLALLLATGALAPAWAQTYRSIGPDGKITYSDRKPTDPQQHTRQLGQTVVAPLFAPAGVAFDLRPAAAPPPPRPALGAGETPPLDIEGKPFPPGLPEAVLDVLIHQFFVQTLVESCSRVHPNYTERYQGGVRNWRDRNGSILARSNRVTFSRFTGEQRDTLRITARARLAPLLPGAEASEAERQQWCDVASTDLVTRRFELVGDQRVAPLMNYPAP